MWTIYRDAKVAVAASKEFLRLFIQIPIYDQRTFTLHRIHQIPIRIDETHSLRYEELPAFLAVAADGQTFLELTQEEATECEEGHKPVCHLHGALAKRNGPGACALELLLEPEGMEHLYSKCRRVRDSRQGPVILYLDERRWIMANTLPIEIT